MILRQPNVSVPLYSMFQCTIYELMAEEPLLYAVIHPGTERVCFPAALCGTS